MFVAFITEREDGIISLSVYFRLSWRCLKRRMECKSKRADSQSIMLQLVSQKNSKWNHIKNGRRTVKQVFISHHFMMCSVWYRTAEFPHSNIWPTSGEAEKSEEPHRTSFHLVVWMLIQHSHYCILFLIFPFFVSAILSLLHITVLAIHV